MAKAMRPRAATTVVAVAVGGAGKGVLVGGCGVSLGPLVSVGSGVAVGVAVAVALGGRMRVAVLVGPSVGVEVDVTSATSMGVGTRPAKLVPRQHSSRKKTQHFGVLS